MAKLGPELDFLAIAGIVGEKGNVRDRVSRWIASGQIIGVVKGIYVTAPELRKRPVSLEILANMIHGPSYVSFECVLLGLARGPAREGPARPSRSTS
ncbi:MAG: hypothetical protein M0001_11225 [Treponema sp.]|nr:hypothetical protein [Treponema sp.]